jgi:CoA:oxalate CoA-transferase
MEGDNGLPRQLLSGIRVLDLTQAIAGPFCTRLLHDLGAEVIKIESPPLGDIARYVRFVKKGYSGYFMQNNCGKKSLCLNLKTEEGRAVFKRLVAISDICVENFTPGVMKRLGIDYESLIEVNPRLIMCSISGFGQYGPWAHRRGLAATAHALSGVMWVTGKNENPDAPPRPPGAAFGDTGASLHAVGAICAALYSREKTGIGEYIDISLLDAVFDQQDSAIEIYTLSDGKETAAIARYMKAVMAMPPSQ